MEKTVKITKIIKVFLSNIPKFLLYYKEKQRKAL